MDDSIVDLGFACLDLEREKRCGRPEVIYGEGKDPEDFAQIASALWDRTGRVLATRCNSSHYAAVKSRLSAAVYHERARCIVVGQPEIAADSPCVGIVCAGTSDLPIAEECSVSLGMFGRRCRMFTDVGVAGIHRLFRVIEDLRSCSVLVVIAGMEGALPSVVGGLVCCPVIAVPTSVGYGSAFGGMAALLGMLNSCAAGLVVTNIDNGFGAAAAADRMMTLTK